MGAWAPSLRRPSAPSPGESMQRSGSQGDDGGQKAVKTTRKRKRERKLRALGSPDAGHTSSQTAPRTTEGAPRPTKKRKNKKKKKKRKEHTSVVAAVQPAEPDPDPFWATVRSSVGQRAGTLSDWLNPTHPHFWPRLKEAWKGAPKRTRRSIVALDQDRCLALRSRVITHPFDTKSDDHCETGVDAYRDVAPLLSALARALGKKDKDLAIYDPYYCDGAVVRNLATLGFTNVYNRCEDFYKRMGSPPPHDVLLTNPPYSGDHVEKLLAFERRNSKPTLLLMPNYVSAKTYFPRSRFSFVVPRKRYMYWTPKGLRPKDKLQSHVGAAGVRTSPFVSFWYVSEGLAKLVGANKIYASASQMQPRNRLAFFASSVQELPRAVRPEHVRS